MKYAIGTTELELSDSLANALVSSQERLEEADLHEDAEEFDESEDDDEITLEDVETLIESHKELEEENQILADMVRSYQAGGQSRADGYFDEPEEEEEEELSPQEIAMFLLREFTRAKPFLPKEASIEDYEYVEEIYQEALSTVYPESLNALNLAMMDEEDSSIALSAAFEILLLAKSTRKDSVDESEVDNQFAEGLGVRADAVSLAPRTFSLKPLY